MGAASTGRPSPFEIFVATLSLDALCIVAAGALAGEKAPNVILPFALVLSIDRALTLASTSLTEVARDFLYTSDDFRGPRATGGTAPRGPLSDGENVRSQLRRRADSQRGLCACDAA